MPTVYSASSSQWPLLQSKTEQKFKSGLFNVSAEFIRPVGNIELPTSIETSIGPVDVWPEPTVSSGTDGFERINATGYGIWATDIQEVIFGYEVATLTGKAKAIDRCKTDDYYKLQTFGTGESSYEDWVLMPGCGPGNWCGSLMASTETQLNGPEVQVILENIYIKAIGDEVPESPALKIYDEEMNQIQGFAASTAQSGYLLMNLNAYYQINGYVGTFSKSSPFKLVISSLKKNKYGNITETEVAYSLRGPSVIDFGTWNAGVYPCVPPTKPPLP